ncbi:MAG: S-methyl-5'-thioadenosine phosphorylase [Alphaproteobacteria bacterium MarineAlpha6_Bin6]|nr:MAG: S-methyl-5'-thioadenosine phosphorylase [Alphaproteobacteria bacterium MarineAlpha6_Bin6]PPR33518.1 MAG: S-methyl-5'-thioadenosine phosphorylase [Alphaproteobacteria bacterium MarineAlpha6_Bin5]|tara:strand:- start:5425 stop:6306 length:882 start_codon:yes stop_codon:yes gene_type:complete
MKKSFLLAFIGGSGIYQIEDLKNKKWINVNTPWGKPSDKILTGIVNNRKVLFLPRHGRNHIYNPSEINYRANIYALKKLGATDIISLSACGSLKERLSPGTFVLVDQFIDKTLIRKKTFFEEGIVAHVSMANPTSEILRNACEEVLKKLKIKYQRRGTYLAMEGPQFSSKAESESYRKQKIDVIGMTNMPEAKLAREAEIRYATVAMVTDYDCWHKKHDDVDVEQIINTLNKNSNNAKALVKNIIDVVSKHITRKKDFTENILDKSIITQKKHWNKKSKKKLNEILKRYLEKN